MQVESYEVEEVKGEMGEMAADATAIELIERLGLSGQKKLTNTETQTRVHFRRMTALESLVFGTLFPEKDKVEGFATEIMPVRVLQLLEKAKQEPGFIEFKVWHSTTRKDDPILVGVMGERQKANWGEYITNETHYLIARWGEALAPFEKLVAEARAVWTAARRQGLKKQEREAKAMLESLEDDADVAFRTGRAPTD